MKTELEKLRAANPVGPDNARAWLNTDGAEHARHAALAGSAALELGEPGRSHRGRWLVALAGAAAVLAMGLPALLQPENLATPPTSIVSTAPDGTRTDSFYADQLLCVGDRVGQDLGQLEVDPDGLPTDAGQSSIDAAATTFPAEFTGCFAELVDEPVSRVSGRLFPGSRTIPEVEVSLLVPEAWQSTDQDLTPIVTGPQEAISLATFILEAGGDKCAHVPVRALEAMSPDDVFIQILNSGGHDRRPSTFAGRLDQMQQGEHIECLNSRERGDIGSLGWMSFADNGHGFYLMVALGAELDAGQLHLVELVLDSIAITEVDASPTTLAAARPAGWSHHEVSFQMKEGSSYAVGDNHLFVWGGAPDRSGRLTNDGVLVDLDSGGIRPVPAAPIDPRYLASIVWTGSEFLVFGGHSFDESFVDGAAFDPADESWRPITPAPLSPAPNPSAVWRGTEMVVWLGGSDITNITDPPASATGQLAVYYGESDTWSDMKHPDFAAVDAVLLSNDNDLALVGGPGMRDFGVVRGAHSLYGSLFDSSLGLWTEPARDLGTESARAFIGPAGVGVLRDDGEIHLLDDTGWNDLTAIDPACGWDLAAVQAGRRTCLKLCGNVYQLMDTTPSLILTAEDPLSTSNTYGSGFLGAQDGRLVVFGDDEEGADSNAMLGVYEPGD